MREHSEEQKPLTRTAKKLFSRLDLYHEWSTQYIGARIQQEKDERTVIRCCRSREGTVEGVKCSLREIVCRMMLSLFLVAIIRDSAELKVERGCDDL